MAQQQGGGGGGGSEGTGPIWTVGILFALLWMIWTFARGHIVKDDILYKYFSGKNHRYFYGCFS